MKHTGIRATTEIITLNCKQCSKEFTLTAAVFRSREKQGRPPTYCSIECARAKPELSAQVACAHCAAVITKKLCRVKEKNFCNKVCMGKSRANNGPWSATPDVEVRREYFRAWIEKNREAVNSRSRAWNKANRAYKNFSQQKRRAAGVMTYDQWKAMIDAAGSCNSCGTTERLEVDHIHPVSLGGLTEPGNLQVLCRTCNARKGGKSVLGIDVVLTK